MLPTGTPISISTAGTRSRSARAGAIKEAWRAGEPPDAAGALEANPDLAADRALALDLAYEEFCAREEAGEPLASEQFCSRFPFGPSLRRLIAVHRFLDEHPAFLDAVPSRWPAIGSSCGDFVIVRELGQGGFSRVYLASETTAGNRPVALKVSSAGSREADTLGPLSHPHLIPVLSSRRVGEWTLVAMPFAGTATIEDVLSTVWSAKRARAPRSAAPILEAAYCGGQADDPEFPSRPAFDIQPRQNYEDGVTAIAGGLFAAVAHLHGKGFAHRDIKPSNVLLAPTGHPYLLDFNLATGGSEVARVAGTLPYMAPEQLELVANPAAAAPADWRPADVFACGIILYELLVGRYPFGESNEASGRLGQTERASALLVAQRTRDRRWRPFNARPGRAVRTAIDRCLNLDPNERPVAAELAALFAEARRPKSRGRYVVAALAIAVLLSIVLIAVSGRAPRTSAAASLPAPGDAFGRGLQLYRQGDHALAASEFLKAGEATKNARAYAYAAYCLTLLKDHRSAIVVAGEAIRFGERDPSVYVNRAYNHLITNALDRSKEDCEEALRLDPGNRPARLTRANFYLERFLRRGREIPPEAIADIESVTSGTPNTANVWMTAAQLYIHSPGAGPESRDKAIRAVREAIALGRAPTAIRRNPKLMAALSGHAAFEDALRCEPGSVDPSINPQIAGPPPAR